MKITYLDNYQELSNKAAEMIYQNIVEKPDLMLCAATGSSPLLTYQKLIEKYRQNSEVFSKLKVLKLDEWGGISMENKQSCEHFLQTNLVQPMKIDDLRYISFNSNALNKEKECERIDSYIHKKGPIDLCVLGLGLNGHVAFNEPGTFLHAKSHIVDLTEDSLKHPMAKNMGEIPKYGLTIGMADILQSRKIIMLITGKGKEEKIKEFLSGKISTRLPASFLWLHANTECLIDSESYSLSE